MVRAAVLLTADVGSIPTWRTMNMNELNKFKTGGFPSGYPEDRKVFYSPVDNVHGALLYTMRSCARSLYLSMFGFDDQEIAYLIHSKLQDPRITVLLTLDASQATGKHEAEILAQEHYPSSIVSIGHSEHGAIMHMKEIVVDGEFLISGSTNLSTSGESLQDNECSIHQSVPLCAEATARQIAIHANMLKAK